MRVLKQRICFLAVFIVVANTIANASPWLTGPILAPSGHTIPAGYSNLELYGFDINTSAAYNADWQRVKTPHYRSLQANPIFSHGLNSFMDVQFSFPFVWDKFEDERTDRLADSAVALGFQLLEQKGRTGIPDLRVSIQEIIPTGRFQQLSATSNGTDATGVGSYQAGVYFNFQYLMPVFQTHYLRTRLSLGYVYPAYVRIEGTNAYGGAEGANGKISPGNLVIADAATEYTVTQNWVAVMEVYYANREPTKLISGTPGLTPRGTLAPIGAGEIDTLSLVPAIEYNFSDKIGLIGGVWFTVKGKNTSDFVAGVLALNVFF